MTKFLFFFTLSTRKSRSFFLSLLEILYLNWIIDAVLQNGESLNHVNLKLNAFVILFIAFAITA